jgi:hypothetical protein
VTEGDALRDQIAEALFRDVRLWFHFTERFAHLGGVTEARYATADAMMPVVDAALASARAEIEMLQEHSKRAYAEQQAMQARLDARWHEGWHAGHHAAVDDLNLHDATMCPATKEA